MTNETLPILYSFRRCPYAMRARLAIAAADVKMVIREVVLRDKPAHMLEISPKGTVPVLLLPDGTVLEESYDVMKWALKVIDPERWLNCDMGALAEFIKELDGPFKHNLDRYKYATRYDGAVAEEHRTEAMIFIYRLEAMLSEQSYLAGENFGFADAATAPFVRQFMNTDPNWFHAEPIPKVIEWVTDFMESPRFKAIMAKLPQWKEGDECTYFPFKTVI